LSDDSVQVYFDKGTPLPARRTVAHQAVQSVLPGERGEALLIPVIQGEFARAHLNRHIGSLRIDGQGLAQRLPAGTRIEVTLTLDRSGQLAARADVPTLGATFEDVVHVLVPSASLDVLGSALVAGEGRLNELRRRAFRSRLEPAVEELRGADALLLEARDALSAARGGDADAAQRVQRLVLDLEASLDAAEDALRWPELQGAADQDLAAYLSWISSLGTPAEQQLAQRAAGEALAARERRDAAELARQLETVRSLFITAHARHPDAPRRNFDWYAAHLSDAMSVPRAQELLKEGRAALAREDLAALRAINRQLDELYAGTPEQRSSSFGSGVQ
jgi:molecular chaperone DnaK